MVSKKPFSKFFNPSPKVLYGLIGAIVLLVGFIIVFLNPLLWKKHDQNLERFVQSFEQIPLPSNTKQIGVTLKFFGLLGNSNHCDYSVSKLIQSDLTEGQLKEYFNQFTLPAVDPEENMEGYANKLRGTKPNKISISKTYTEEPIILGPYYKGTEEEKRKYIQELLGQKGLATAQRYTVDIYEISDKVFTLSSSDFGYRANDYRCH